MQKQRERERDERTTMKTDMNGVIRKCHVAFNWNRGMCVCVMKLSSLHSHLFIRILIVLYSFDSGWLCFRRLFVSIEWIRVPFVLLFFLASCFLRLRSFCQTLFFSAVQNIHQDIIIFVYIERGIASKMLTLAIPCESRSRYHTHIDCVGFFYHHVIDITVISCDQQHTGTSIWIQWNYIQFTFDWMDFSFHQIRRREQNTYLEKNELLFIIITVDLIVAWIGQRKFLGECLLQLLHEQCSSNIFGYIGKK